MSDPDAALLQRWREYFARKTGGSDAEIEAAAVASLHALRRGESKAAAVQAGEMAAARLRGATTYGDRPSDPARRTAPPSASWTDFTLPGDENDLAQWERLQEQKRIADRRVNWRVMRKTPSGIFQIVFTTVVGALLLIGGGWVIWNIASGNWTGPPGTEQELVVVPEVVGVDISEASARLHDVGLDETTREVEDRTVPTFTIVGSEPAAGTTVAKGTRVVLIMAFPGSDA